MLCLNNCFLIYLSVWIAFYFLPLTQQSAEAMQYFQAYQNLLPFLVGYGNLAKYGITAPNRFQKYLFNFTSCMGHFMFTSGLLLEIAYLTLEAKNLHNYADGLYLVATLVCTFISYISLRWRYSKCFQLIDSYKIIIEERMLPKLKIHFSYSRSVTLSESGFICPRFNRSREESCVWTFVHICW